MSNFKIFFVLSFFAPILASAAEQSCLTTIKKTILNSVSAPDAITLAVGGRDLTLHVSDELDPAAVSDSRTIMSWKREFILFNSKFEPTLYISQTFSVQEDCQYKQTRVIVNALRIDTAQF